MAVREITMDELRKHTSPTDCWVVVHGSVYALPHDFADTHPGGDVFMDGAGADATELFESAGHSEDAVKVLATFKIGVLKA
jgi:cytochrome b involved in lipid metabolism